MRKLFGLLLLIVPCGTFAQQVHPNISYNALINAACTNTNTSCPNAVFVTGSNSLPSSGPSGPIGTGTTLDIPVSNYNAATVTISGTYSGVTVNFEFSDPTAGTNYFTEICARSDVNTLESSEVVTPNNTVRAWQCPVWAATRFRIRVSAISSGTVNTWITLTEAAIDPSLVVAAQLSGVSVFPEPCTDPGTAKSSVPISITTATTTELVASTASKSVYVCGGSFTIQGAASVNSVQFETGTKTTTACDTTPSVRTGTYQGNGATANVPIFIELPGQQTNFTSISGGEICAVTAGAAVSIQGYITYVVQ